jgi:hypothetical protein
MNGLPRPRATAVLHQPTGPNRRCFSKGAVPGKCRGSTRPRGIPAAYAEAREKELDFASDRLIR